MAAVSQSAFLVERTQDSSPERSPRRLRTMVVDDSDTFLKVTCSVLDLEDVIDLVAASSDGLEAIDTVTRLKPALILLDVHMPGLDGLAITSLLARMSPAPAVVLMSSDDTPNLRAACRRAGAFDFVHKTNFRSEFEAVLRRLLERQMNC
jgi:CheY-like chemotaxis protein